MGNKIPRLDGASSSRAHESESPQQDIEQISDGFYKFYEPSPASSANLDIFFFHGLECESAYARDAHILTWKSSGEMEEIWPQKWLSQDFPQARIIAVRYDCGMKQTDTDGRMDLYLIAENLVQEIGWARPGGSDRTVILVGHGFGGIVIKKLCVYAQKKIEKSVGENEMSILLESIRGFFFYATPHLGAQGMEAPAEKEGALVRWMRTLNSESARLHEDFCEMWRTRRYRWTIYGLGGTESKFGQPWLQVPEASSRFGDNYITVPGDHLSVCRPSDRRSNNYKHLQNFVAEIERQVQLEKKPLLMVPKITVGVDALLTRILEKDIRDHQFMGFCGMGGVGKTTLSKLVFNRIYTKFEYCCFVEEIKHISGTNDEVKSKIWEKMRHHGVPVRSASGSSGGDKWNQVNGRLLFVVFDDVEDTNHVKLLKEIAYDNGMEDSRFILTSRDINCLEGCGPECEIHIRRLDSLKYEDANKLFITYAFPRQQEPPESFKSVVKQVVDGCEGLPLTLEVLGSYLKGKDIGLWEEIPVALRQCDKIASLEEKVWSKLQLSYDRLPGDEVKQMFLDIASVFLEWKYIFSGDDAIIAWNSLFQNAYNRLQMLEDRALVRSWQEKDRYGKDCRHFYMHEHLKRMGQRIARLEGRSIGWLQSSDSDSDDDDEDDGVFSRGDQELGMMVACRMNLNSPVREQTCTFCFIREFWPKLTAIRYMHLRVGQYRRTKFHLHCCERCRNRECPLPSTLVLLRLDLRREGNFVISAGVGGNYPDGKTGTLSVSRCSSLVKLVLSWCESVDLGGMNELRSMRVLKIECCREVQNWPTSLRELKHLERLELESIDESFELPTAFGDLTKLQHLSIMSCKVRSVPSSLRSLTSLRCLEVDKVVGRQPVPNIIGSMRQLQVLCLACWKLFDPVDALRELTVLRELTLKCEGILELPETLGNSTNSETVQFRSVQLCCVQKEFRKSFSRSVPFGRLLEAICQLSHLQSLRLESVKELVTLPEALGNLRSLQKLEIRNCEVESLPESLGQLSSLTSLRVVRCGDLKSLPETIGDLASLESLFLYDSGFHSLPESLGRLSGLKDLEVRSCRDFKTLPETIGNLSNLRTLDVSYSALHSIPESLGRLSCLVLLRVRSCKNLKTLPESIRNLSSLQVLVLTNSPVVHSLPNTLRDLSNLRVVTDDSAYSWSIAA